MIDFEIAVENEPRAASIPSKQGAGSEQTSALEESVLKLSGQLSTVTRQQKYFRTRENRNFSTVRSTEQRIWNFSLIESLMMVGMAGLQVFVVRMFFQGGRKGEFGNSPLALDHQADNPQVTCKCQLRPVCHTSIEKALFDTPQCNAMISVSTPYMLSMEFAGPNKNEDRKNNSMDSHRHARLIPPSSPHQ